MKKNLIIAVVALFLIAAIAGIFLIRTDDEGTQTTVPSDAVEQSESVSAGPDEMNPEESESTAATVEPDNSDPTVPSKKGRPEENNNETVPSETTEPPFEEESRETMPEDTAPPIIVEPETQPAEKTEYEKYNDMTAGEQEDFYNSFESPDAFFEWYNTVKKEYETQKNEIIVDGSTNIELRP